MTGSFPPLEFHALDGIWIPGRIKGAVLILVLADFGYPGVRSRKEEGPPMPGSVSLLAFAVSFGLAVLTTPAAAPAAAGGLAPAAPPGGEAAPAGAPR